jgi:flavin reductase (DIM6/NTAB) family NADH-FMN oxidoreductase RutF
VTATQLLPYRGDLARLKEVYAEYPSGIAALGAVLNGDDVLMIASSFTVGVSYDPPMCSVAIQRSSQTWARLKQAPLIGVSALGAGHVSSVWQLASRRRDHRLDHLESTTADTGSMFLHGATAWIECAVVAEYEAGDHVIVLFEVRATHIEPESTPLILHRGRVFEGVPSAVVA